MMRAIAVFYGIFRIHLRRGGCRGRKFLSEKIARGSEKIAGAGVLSH
ncbi:MULTISPECIES: hypothetical protein [Bradyrhizobium]|nr:MULTISPECIES: hypothetical protein [Bradyrhizobium]QOG21264.1 hypothetical protein FOM02_32070 [Bradyrhizobium sp. SEMIA]UFW51806.1 hypothetical protein BaraCB756_12845 [Bradyrhizobium arachidis]